MDKPDQTALEAVRALKKLASPQPWVLSAGGQWIWSGASSPYPILVPHALHPSPRVRERGNAAYAAMAVNSIEAAVAALVKDHGPHWKEGRVSRGYAVSKSCEEAECDVCTLLAAIKAAAQAAL